MAEKLRWLYLALLVAVLAIVGCGKGDVVGKPDGSQSTSSTTEPGGSGDVAANPGSEGSTEQAGDGNSVTNKPSDGTTAAAGGTDSAGAGSDDAAPGQGEYLLRLNVKKGQKFAYLVTQETEAMGAKSTLTLDTVMTVLDVSGDKMTIEYKVLDVKVSGGGPSATLLEQQAKALKNTSYTADYDKFGRMSNIKSHGAGNPFQGLAGDTMMGTAFPEKPVKVGSKWTADAPMPVPGQENKPIKVHYEVTQASGDTVTIGTNIDHSLTIEGPPGARGQQAGSAKMSMKANGTSDVEVATGMPKGLKMVIQMTIEIPKAPSQTQKITLTMKRK